ncbi:hypothetical protein RFI_03696 [Reticulomyxa filosa]|uniref:Uncharacterized protein n=1 Tax=Reticulomyxa filosa TaxID=46433 RepID=X6P5G3_RETFI|nr:hypothetical protein RFI_03696 [Reticulomyxa filosa]|eukprot:ETO33411.1 hypothetical protein RFI_03696 [Reticulomyxa filosa]
MNFFSRFKKPPVGANVRDAGSDDAHVSNDAGGSRSSSLNNGRGSDENLASEISGIEENVRQGHYTKSVQRLREILEKHPNNWKCHYLMAMILDKIFAVEEVIHHMKLALEHIPSDDELKNEKVDLMGQLSLAYAKEDKWQTMADICQKALQLNAYNVTALRAGALVCALGNQYSNAAVYYKRALEVCPTDLDLLCDLISFYYLFGNWDLMAQYCLTVTKASKYTQDSFEYAKWMLTRMYRLSVVPFLFLFFI